MYTILVPVDGSSHALKALHIANDLAERYKGHVALLHVLATNKEPAEFLALGVAKTFGPKLTAALQAAARQGAHAGGGAAEPGHVAIPEPVLRAMGEKILHEADAKTRHRGLEPEILPIEAGDPADCIVLAARRLGANVIVMGCRGVSAAQARPLGSISHAVFERAECTCISVK